MHITIIAKTPVPGIVKTRLCPPCTPQEAADIARAGLLDTIDAIDGAFSPAQGATRTLLLDGAIESWMPPSWRVVRQRGSGLGERLRNGFAELGQGIIVGMETPHVASLLPNALQHLREGTDVFGPADDGGYWAIGLCARTAASSFDVFDGVEMSTSVTGEEQLRRLCALGGSIALLPSARDLDDYADLCWIAESALDGRLADIARGTVDRVDSLRGTPVDRHRSMPISSGLRPRLRRRTGIDATVGIDAAARLALPARNHPSIPLGSVARQRPRTGTVGP